MRFSREDLTAQGEQMGGQTVYLSGFSYAVVLAACELATYRYRWAMMTDSEWDELDADLSQMSLEVQKNAMLGTIIPFVGAVIPQYLLLCDGGTYARSDYEDLYAILPAALIVDADNFTVPDMAGLTAVGATIARPLLTAFGEEEHTLTEAEMPTHSHDYIEPVSNVDLEDVGVPEVGASRALFPSQTGTRGGGQPHNNMQPSISLYWCMVAR